MTAHRLLPHPLVFHLSESPFREAIELLETWMELRGLELLDATTPAIPGLPVFYVMVPVPDRVHPLLSLQPPPNNPAVPLHRMKVDGSSPYQAPESRLELVTALNSVMAPSERKSGDYADRAYRIPWRYFATPSGFAGVTAVLDSMIARIRRAG